MADRLTQLQDALDNQLTMMYAALNYIQTHHPYGHFPGQPSQAPAPAPIVTTSTNGTAPQQPNGPSQQAPDQPPGTPPPDRPEVFQNALRELAQGLVLQEQQMEILINSLPGLGSSEASQVRRMRELEGELREAEEERARMEDEKEGMLERLGDVLSGVRRVV